MALYVTRHTPANSPTFASRGFGYLGLTLYESVVPGFSQKQSLAGQLNGLAGLPVPEPGRKYNWLLSLNAGQAALLKSIYRQTSGENKARIDSLEAALQRHFSHAEADPAVVARSVQFGRAVAAAVFAWSKGDGGHRGYLRNFDPHLRYPAGPGAWRAPFFSQTISRFPLHPHWGQNRTFLAADQHWPMPACIPYDTATGSAYADQFREVYEANRGLTGRSGKSPSGGTTTRATPLRPRATPTTWRASWSAPKSRIWLRPPKPTPGWAWPLRMPSSSAGK
jgi:hypothetical protein